MKVSVVVCARNEEAFIENCLKALKAQKRVEPEIIVIDGHSTDNTVKLAKKYTSKVYYDNGKGIANARNVGWQHASGDIVAYCDADCKPRRNWISKIQKIMSQKDYVAIYGPVVPYDGNIFLRLNLKFWGDWARWLTDQVNYPTICAANVAFRRSVLKKHPFKINNVMEDFEIGDRLRKIGRVKFIRRLKMPISGRRFKESFYIVAIRDYFFNYLRLKFGRELKSKYWEERFSKSGEGRI